MKPMSEYLHTHHTATWRKRMSEYLHSYMQANPNVSRLIAISAVEGQLAADVEESLQYVTKKGHDVEANLSRATAELLLFRTMYR